MSNEVFDSKILVEKLSKLNNSQQSIESLSRLCISHRKEARVIVETWEKMFNPSQKEQCVSFLYLANDILQNSRRKGSEFVNEFWKVLPASLKNVYDNGDEAGKKAATRLVDIWEERKVFGSRVHSLKDELAAKHGKVPAPQVVSNGKTANPIKIVKKDAQALRIKLAVGGFPEKIVSAYHFVHDECSNEDSDVANCSAAVVSAERIVKELESTINQGIYPDSGIEDEMHEHENVLQQCIKQLEGAEASRVALVSLLKEALQDQEAKLESLRGQLLMARDQINDVENLKPKIAMQNQGVSAAGVGVLTEPLDVGELSKPSGVQPGNSLQNPASQPITNAQTPGHQIPLPPILPATSFASLVVSDEETKKAAAAAVAAKLTASSSSAQMLTSIFSSLVAEEAASMNDSLRKVGFASNLPMFSPEKRQKVEHPSSVSDAVNTESSSSPYFTPLRQPISSMPMSQPNQMPMGPTPPPPPPPPMMPSNSVSNQFVQSSGMMLNMMPYGFGGSGLPPPPPLPSHIAMGLARPPNPQNPQQLQPPHQQNVGVGGGYYQPHGIGLYGSNSQPSTPPMQRQ